MKIIGLTGGIGSGKTRVLDFFKSKGIPCYQADLAGHKVLNENEDIKAKVKAFFGETIYTNEGLDRARLGKRVFQDKEALAYLNSLVHPAVRADFQNFVSQQSAPFIINEVAILFENNGHLRCDKTILVTAPQAERIARVIARDGQSREEIVARMDKQWSDEKKIPLADYVIKNLDWNDTLLQLEKIYEAIVTFALSDT